MLDFDAIEVHVSPWARTYVVHLFDIQSPPDLGNSVALYGNPFELSSCSVETDCDCGTDLNVSVGWIM
jgi:hypothetical protein